MSSALAPVLKAPTTVSNVTRVPPTRITPSASSAKWSRSCAIAKDIHSPRLPIYRSEPQFSICTIAIVDRRLGSFKSSSPYRARSPIMDELLQIVPIHPVVRVQIGVRVGWQRVNGSSKAAGMGRIEGNLAGTVPLPPQPGDDAAHVVMTVVAEQAIGRLARLSGLSHRGALRCPVGNARIAEGQHCGGSTFVEGADVLELPVDADRVAAPGLAERPRSKARRMCSKSCSLRSGVAGAGLESLSVAPEWNGTQRTDPLRHTARRTRTGPRSYGPTSLLVP